jgi:hypothetical protein
MKKLTLVVTLVLLAVPLLAQGRKSAGSPLKATVAQVADRRTTSFFSELSIRLELTDVKAADVSAVKVNVTRAVDDTGRDLVDPKAEPKFEPTGGPMSFGRMRPEEDTSPATVTITLENPDREALTVQEVTGEVELYMPGKDRDAVAIIPKFQAQAGKPISHRALKASGVEIIVMGPAQLEAAKKKAGEAKRAEAKSQGADEETIAWMVSSVIDSFFTPATGEIALKIKDPNNRIHELGFVPPNGEAQRAFTQDRDGLMVLASYGEPVGADWALKVNLRTPKTVQKHTLSLKDIPLP